MEKTWRHDVLLRAAHRTHHWITRKVVKARLACLAQALGATRCFVMTRGWDGDLLWFVTLQPNRRARNASVRLALDSSDT